MAKRVTPQRAAAMLRKLDTEFDKAQLIIGRELTKRAHMLSVTKYMEPLGTGKGKRDAKGRFSKHAARPPNAPPGPIGIRSGNLRRAVIRLEPAKKGSGVEVGLSVDLQKAPYGRIHEKGGTTGPHVIRPKNKKALKWEGPDGPIFAGRVNHPGSKIPARPFLEPAVTEAAEQAPEVGAEVMRALVDKLQRQM